MLNLENTLFIDSSGHASLAILAILQARSAIKYSHLISDNSTIITSAYEFGLRDHSGDTVPEIVRLIAGTYSFLKMDFGLLVLTEICPDQSDSKAIEEWNELIDAARPMLDVADGVVVCITKREFDPQDLRSPDKTYLVKTTSEAIRLLLNATSV